MCSATLLNCLSSPAKRMLIAWGAMSSPGHEIQSFFAWGSAGAGGGGVAERSVGILVKSLSADDLAWCRGASEL